MHPYRAQGARRQPVYQGLRRLWLTGSGSGGDNCVSSGRNTGAGSSIFLSALGEEMSTQHPSLESGGAQKSV